MGEDNMKSKPGFTLIELLIVITIIAILAAFTIGITGSMRRKAITQQTKSTIEQLNGACKSYWNIYRNFPDLNHFPPGSAYPGKNKGAIAAWNDNNMVEFNKRLRFYLEDIVYVENPGAPKFAQKEHPPLIQGALPKVTDDTEMYVDGWGQALRVWWGRDHTGDTPPGPRNYVKGDERYRYLPDIYSFGDDQEDDVGGEDTKTTADLEADGFDDLVNWHAEVKN